MPRPFVVTFAAGTVGAWRIDRVAAVVGDALPAVRARGAALGVVRLRAMSGMQAMSLFAMLLDRSVARIGELAADGRFFDRQEVARIADVWDNNTFPLFIAATCRPAWVRERRARTALRWMADLGPSRREWMIEQTAGAGSRLESMLDPLVPDALHYRDYQGRVRPGQVPLTAMIVASIADDYDLDRAGVRSVRVERAGQQLSGHVAVAAPRRYAGVPDVADAVVNVYLSGVEVVRFDSADTVRPSLSADAIGVEVRFGTEGCVRAASATVGFDDSWWHLSHAGRVADAHTPHRSARSRHSIAWPWLRGSAGVAAIGIHEAMLAVRSVGYPHLVGRVPLRELHDTLADAGDAVLDACSLRGSARELAFRRLVEQWLAGSPHLAGRLADRLPADHWAHTVSGAAPAEITTPSLPTRAQLTLVRYTAAHDYFSTARDASAVINFAVPREDGTWGLQAAEHKRPAHLAMTIAAFTTPGVATATGSWTLGDGAFTVTQAEPDDPHRPPSSA